MNIPQGDATYDAATANMGSLWKMPTKDQFQELIDGTNRTWTSINGVNGRKFTNKSDSTKYIFLPAAGWYDNTTHNVAGSNGLSWSTTWYTSAFAWSLIFRSNSVLTDYGYRTTGRSVRAIQIISFKVLIRKSNLIFK